MADVSQEVVDIEIDTEEPDDLEKPDDVVLRMDGQEYTFTWVKDQFYMDMLGAAHRWQASGDPSMQYQVKSFLLQCMSPEDQGRFNRHLADPKSVLDLKHLTAAGMALLSLWGTAVEERLKHAGSQMPAIFDEFMAMNGGKKKTGPRKAITPKRK